MTLTPLDILILALATWRLAYLMAKEVAPFQLMTKLRAKTTLGGLLTCVYCSSWWAALIMLVLWFLPMPYLKYLVYIFAVSGAALMLGNYTGSSQQ